MKEKLKQAWVWLRKNVFNKEMIVFVLIAELIFWSPVIVCGALAIFVNAWWWTAVSSIILFWAGPVTPAMPLQFGLALLLKKIWHCITRKGKGKESIKGDANGSKD